MVGICTDFISGWAKLVLTLFHWSIVCQGVPSLKFTRKWRWSCPSQHPCNKRVALHRAFELFSPLFTSAFVSLLSGVHSQPPHKSRTEKQGLGFAGLQGLFFCAFCLSPFKERQHWKLEGMLELHCVDFVCSWSCSFSSQECYTSLKIRINKTLIYLGWDISNCLCDLCG